jgi:hypothetical protein
MPRIRRSARTDAVTEFKSGIANRSLKFVPTSKITQTRTARSPLCHFARSSRFAVQRDWVDASDNVHAPAPVQAPVTFGDTGSRCSRDNEAEALQAKVLSERPMIMIADR